MSDPADRAVVALIHTMVAGEDLVASEMVKRMDRPTLKGVSKLLTTALKLANGEIASRGQTFSLDFSADEDEIVGF